MKRFPILAFALISLLWAGRAAQAQQAYATGNTGTINSSNPVVCIAPLTGVVKDCTSVTITPSSAGFNLAVTPPDASGTVATGGTFQQVFASNTARTFCVVQNPTSATEPLFVHFTAAVAATTNSVSLGPGASFFCQGNGTVVTGAITVTAATNAHAFVAAGA